MKYDFMILSEEPFRLWYAKFGDFSSSSDRQTDVAKSKGIEVET